MVRHFLGQLDGYSIDARRAVNGEQSNVRSPRKKGAELCWIELIGLGNNGNQIRAFTKSDGRVSVVWRSVSRKRKSPERANPLRK